MAINPLYNTNDSPSNSTQPTKSVNRQGVYVPRTHNTFDNSYFHFKTQKFGQYEPFFVMDAVPGDMVPLHSSHDVRSLPMASPFLSSLKLNKDYFMVPMQAILPNTWEYIFKNPSQGDDVPENANCLFPAYSIDGDFNIIKHLVDLTAVHSDLSYASNLRSLFLAEMFLSQGSLLSYLGYHLNPEIESSLTDGIVSFDNYFDAYVRNIEIAVIRITTDSGIFDYNYSREGDTDLTLSQLVSLIRTFGSRCAFLDLEFFEPVQISINRGYPSFSDLADFGTDINLSRVLAYQISCSQFYVNPNIDYLYNAQLYRDNIFNLYSEFMSQSGLAPSTEFFYMNGIKIQYDYLSKRYFSNALNEIALGDGLTDRNINSFYDYMFAIFGFRESLRFGDYFTDSRTRPLAIGDDNISVSDSNSVSVIDVSKKIVYQRFRNAVVKLGNNFGDYLRGIFGTSPSPDYHFPKFIAHQDFDVNGFEVANSTSIDQGTLVTNLNTRDDNFAFEVDVDMPCVLIGISYMSVPRVYSQTKDRHFFHRDRYDMFNPALQYIGDQIVYNHERTDLRPNDEIFGYQSRNNEYKQRYSIATGGFVTKLPSWTFVSDALFDPSNYIVVSNTQSPDYIRAHDFEFDRFFAQMSGLSLANSFHFIIVYNNKCMSNRPMEVNPNILLQ